MSESDTPTLAQAALASVRGASAEARLIAAEEVLEQLLARGFGECLGTGTETDPGQRVTAVLSGLPEIASLASLSGRTMYHDPALLSRTYARILDRKDVPAMLMAEVIRSNSRDYPRPVLVELFEAPPFDLAPAVIEAALKTMAAGEEYRDISFTTTSLGTVYLFSSLHLERSYAAFLAEQDEAFAMNP